jgi:hypothetical protein
MYAWLTQTTQTAFGIAGMKTGGWIQAEGFTVCMPHQVMVGEKFVIAT